jgi:hypothetical protein
MEIERNKNAYVFLMNIEVGIREFLIESIQAQDVNQWTQDFLGSYRIKLIKKRSGNSIKFAVNDDQDFEERFLSKIQHAYVGLALNETQLYHPFYYLNWEDLIAILGQKATVSLVNPIITNEKRVQIIDELKDLQRLRNDVAHCRGISEMQHNFLEGSFFKISSIIPNFERLKLRFTKERRIEIESILFDVRKFLENQNKQNDQAENLVTYIRQSTNSFWLNTLNPEIVIELKQLHQLFEKWLDFSNKIGGLRENTISIQPEIQRTVSKIEKHHE